MSCVHRYLLESPKGPDIRGVCSLCGDVRTYPTEPEAVHNPHSRHRAFSLRSDPQKKEYSKAEAWKGPRP